MCATQDREEVVSSEDAVDAVRDFYDKHPYPAPIDNLDRHRDIYRSSERRRTVSHLLWPTEKPRTDREILVADCSRA
jgi:hypothetical protein